MANKLKAIRGRWRMKQCWVCGRKFRVYPNEKSEFGTFPDACPDCRRYVELEIERQGASLPGTLYILRQLAGRIRNMEAAEEEQC